MKPAGAAGGGTAGGGGVATAKTPSKSARSRPGGGGVHNIDRNRGSFGDHEAPRFDRAVPPATCRRRARTRPQEDRVQPQRVRGFG